METQEWMNAEVQRAWMTILPKVTEINDPSTIDGNLLGLFCGLFIRYIKSVKNKTDDLNQIHVLCRQYAVDFQLIPVDKAIFVEFDDNGYDQDLVRLFDWQKRMI